MKKKIVLIKCESCGGSDFKKHSSINGFIICNNCGSQYSDQSFKISQIDLKQNKKNILRSEIRGIGNLFS